MKSTSEPEEDQYEYNIMINHPEFGARLLRADQWYPEWLVRDIWETRMKDRDTRIVRRLKAGPVEYVD